MIYHKYITIACAKCNDRHDVPVSCGDRFCPICSVARRGRVRYRLSQLVKLVDPPPGFNPKFITLTIPNSTDLRLGVKSIMASFRRLRQTQFWRNYVHGGAFVIEITGKVGAYHIHIHAIVHAKFIPHSQLMKHWEAVSGGFIVWVKRIPVAAVVAYLCKYLSKCDDEHPDDRTMSDALKGVRLFQPFGSWHSCERKIPKHKGVCPKCKSSDWVVCCLPFRVWLAPDGTFNNDPGPSRLTG